MVQNLKSEVDLTGANKGVEQELESGGVSNDAVLLHGEQQSGDVVVFITETSDAENVRVSARRVFVKMSERRGTPNEEVDFVGRVEGIGVEDLEEERLGERNGGRVEVASAGLRDGFGERGNEEQVSHFR